MPEEGPGGLLLLQGILELALNDSLLVLALPVRIHFLVPSRHTSMLYACGDFNAETTAMRERRARATRTPADAHMDNLVENVGNLAS